MTLTLTAKLPDGTTVPVQAPPAPNVTPPASSFPGDVAAGFLRWGCAIQGDADPYTRHEQPAGVPVGVRRTYYTLAASNTKAISTVATDIKSGRVPWISMKPGAWTWAQIGAGQADAAIDNLLNGIKSQPGPVWLTAHHEPDDEFGDSTALTLAAWKAMQVRYRQRITALGVKNVAFAPVFMSWSWSTQVSAGDPHKASDDWFCPDTWDFIGQDPYWNAGSTSDLGNGLSTAIAWAKKFGLKTAMGELGYRESGTQRQADFLQSIYDRAIKEGWLAVAYYDLSIDLLAGPSLTKFHDLMKLPSSVPASKA